MTTPLPLRSLFISNFRCLEGQHQINLDAPIVLIHGPNGSGKTSLLSAIELALTGEVKSLKRADDQYTSYLAHLGQSYATVGISVADHDQTETKQNVMNASGNEINGTPALDPRMARFYSERCYLDQVSLGRLLEIYQHTGKDKESSLARFVNELLGLDHLDALRDGLHPATHLTRFKSFSAAYSNGLQRMEAAAAELKKANTSLSETEETIAQTSAQLVEAMSQLKLPIPLTENGFDLTELVGTLERAADQDDLGNITQIQRTLTELRGRIAGLLSSASGEVELAKHAEEQAAAAFEAWRQGDGAKLSAIRSDAAKLGVEGPDQLESQLRSHMNRIDTHLIDASELGERLASATLLLSKRAEQIGPLDQQINESQGRAGSLASGLAALQEHIKGEFCPVCDRDFTETHDGPLYQHVEEKILQIAAEGQQLRTLTDRRTELERQQISTQRAVTELEAQLPSKADLLGTRERRSAIASLAEHLDSFADSILLGIELREKSQKASASVTEAANNDRESYAVIELLATAAKRLGTDAPSVDDGLLSAWKQLDEAAQQRQASLRGHDHSVSAARALATQLAELEGTKRSCEGNVAVSAKVSEDLVDQVGEADRRRRVAQDLHADATKTRDSIVNRIFTDSLNGVWADVFSRLAPNEPFTPRFGIPKSTTKALSVKIETRHRSGKKSGKPGAMLSAGNLNTAALSLFISLHLAVEPELPCLVFDDPVQSMDEVHISQFAGLLRTLSKRHDRQIIIAVHERGLYEYLALELSPAFPGDKLITIELGNNDDTNTIRSIPHEWRQDQVVAS